MNGHGQPVDLLTAGLVDGGFWCNGFSGFAKLTGIVFGEDEMLPVGERVGIRGPDIPFGDGCSLCGGAIGVSGLVAPCWYPFFDRPGMLPRLA